MHPSPQGRIQLLFLAIATNLCAQSYVPLDFSENKQMTNGLYPNNSTLGPEFYSGWTFDFLNVANVDGQSIDARVSVLGIAGAYEFVGWLPHYNEANGQPANDLGVYHRFDGNYAAPTGGVAFNITFYQGGDTFTTLATLSDFRLLIYDHDGEDIQSESIRAYYDDGLVGYQLHQDSGIHTHHEQDSVRFDARGFNHSETGPEGGFIAYYKNTSSLRLDMFTTTIPTNQPWRFGIFAGIDGDLSLTGGSTAAFSPFVAVPEPSSALLAAIGASLCLVRRRSPNG
jgi:hypothetical protein